MTVDTQVYALAASRCQANGFNNTVDIQRLAEILQDAIEEFEADLENDAIDRTERLERHGL